MTHEPESEHEQQYEHIDPIKENPIAERMLVVSVLFFIVAIGTFVAFEGARVFLWALPLAIAGLCTAFAAYLLVDNAVRNGAFD